MKKISFLPVLAALLIMGCSGKKEATVSETDSTPLVTVVPAEKKIMPNVIEYTGNVEGYVKNMISSQSAMRIQKINVEVGDRVSKGQLLVQMDPANYLQSKAQMENLKVSYSRAEALLKAGGIAKQEVDVIKTQLDISVEQTRNLEENTRLISPISGIVTDRRFDNGDLASGQPILIVQELNPVKIIISVSEEYFSKMKPGMSIDILLDVFPNEVFKGKVDLIYPTIDPLTKTFKTQIKLNNANLKVRPGMFARVNVDYGMKDCILVPDLAIQKQVGSNERFVFTYKDGVVSRKTVELGTRFNNLFEIKTGVEEGEQVVTAGQSRLLDQMKVKLQK